MIKRTLYFGNPAYLSVKLAQLEIRLPEVEKNNTLSRVVKDDCVKRIPVEDIGVVVLDNKQITITQGVLGALLENNVAVIGSSILPHQRYHFCQTDHCCNSGGV